MEVYEGNNTVNWKSQVKMGKIHYLCKYNRKNHEIIKEHFFPLSGIKVQNDILMVIIQVFSIPLSGILLKFH